MRGEHDEVEETTIIRAKLRSGNVMIVNWNADPDFIEGQRYRILNLRPSSHSGNIFQKHPIYELCKNASVMLLSSTNSRNNIPWKCSTLDNVLNMNKPDATHEEVDFVAEVTNVSHENMLVWVLLGNYLDLFLPKDKVQVCGLFSLSIICI